MPKIALLLYNCNNQNCGHSFYTSSTEYQICPSYGENALNFIERVEATINKDEVKLPTIGETVRDFFKSKNLSLPKKVQITMDTEVDLTGSWDYLASVSIIGDYDNKPDLEYILKEIINDNHTIEEMRENKTINF